MTKFEGTASDYKEVIAYALTRADPQMGVISVHELTLAVFLKLNDLGLIRVLPDKPPM